MEKLKGQTVRNSLAVFLPHENLFTIEKKIINIEEKAKVVAAAG